MIRESEKKKAKETTNKKSLLSLCPAGNAKQICAPLALRVLLDGYTTRNINAFFVVFLQQMKKESTTAQTRLIVQIAKACKKEMEAQAMKTTQEQRDKCVEIAYMAMLESNPEQTESDKVVNDICANCEFSKDDLYNFFKKNGNPDIICARFVEEKIMQVQKAIFANADKKGYLFMVLADALKKGIYKTFNALQK